MPTDPLPAFPGLPRIRDRVVIDPWAGSKPLPPAQSDRKDTS
jgi:hypothetical protein